MVFFFFLEVLSNFLDWILMFLIDQLDFKLSALHQMQGPCQIGGTVGSLHARHHRVVWGKVLVVFLFYLHQNKKILPPIRKLCNFDLTLSFLASILLFKRTSI